MAPHSEELPFADDNCCFISPSRARRTVTVSSLNPSHSTINLAKRLGHSSFRIARWSDPYPLLKHAVAPALNL
jgi:hypothetical protein